MAKVDLPQGQLHVWLIISATSDLLMHNAFVSVGRSLAVFLTRKNGDSFWSSVVSTCYVNVYFASLTILIIEASTSLAISFKVESPDKALSISIGLI
jgi:hypothetical protein